MVTQYTYRLTRIPDALQGRANSVFRVIAFGAEPLSLALTGALLQWLGPAYTVLLLFVPQLVMCDIATTYTKLWRAAEMVVPFSINRRGDCSFDIRRKLVASTHLPLLRDVLLPITKSRNILGNVLSGALAGFPHRSMFLVIVTKQLMLGDSQCH